MADRSQEIGRAVVILDVGAMRLRAEPMAAGLGDDVALASGDLLARIIAPRAPSLGGLHRLAVDHPADGLASRPSVRRHAGPAGN